MPQANPASASPDGPLPSATVTSAPAELIDFAASDRVRAGHQGGAGRVDLLRPPRHLADGQPVAVGRGERQPLADDLDPDAGEHRQRVVPTGGDRHLPDRGGEGAAADLAGGGRDRGQGRIVLDRAASAA